MGCQLVLQRVHTIFSASCRSSIVCEIHSLRLFDCAIGRRGLLAACPAFEKYPQLIDVSGAGALSPASRLVIIGFGTGYALSCCAFNYHECHNPHLSTWLSYGRSWKTFSMFFSSITFLLSGGSHMRDPLLPRSPSSSFLLRSELLPQSSRELFTVK